MAAKLEESPAKGDNRTQLFYKSVGAVTCIPPVQPVSGSNAAKQIQRSLHCSRCVVEEAKGVRYEKRKTFTHFEARVHACTLHNAHLQYLEPYAL